jgi:hypothetical protein
MGSQGGELSSYGRKPVGLKDAIWNSGCESNKSSRITRFSKDPPRRHSGHEPEFAAGAR